MGSRLRTVLGFFNIEIMLLWHFILDYCTLQRICHLCVSYQLFRKEYFRLHSKATDFSWDLSWWFRVIPFVDPLDCLVFDVGSNVM